MSRDRFRYFVILGSMRTGSNLLERNIAQYPGTSIYGELFNPAFIGKPGRQEAFGMDRAARDRTPAALIAAMLDDAGDTLPGFRLFDGHDPRVMRHVIADRSAAKIVLRRPVADSYVSLKIARATDQWMLSSVRKRRVARIRFDAREYDTYRRDTAAHYATIRRLLQAAGETAFEIAFDEAKDLDILNGLARFLGLKETLNRIDEPIARQNPGALADKVENYEEMLAHLGREGEPSGVDVRTAAKGGIGQFHAAHGHPLLYAAIPGGPVNRPLDWLQEVGQGTEPIRFESRKDFETWRNGQGTVEAFTIVSHPLERLYRVFENRILDTGPAGFGAIRSHLVDHHGLAPPPTGADEPESGVAFSAERHRDNFLLFLEFVRENLAGRTPIRMDRHWTPQAEFLRGFGEITPLTLVLTEDRMLRGAAYLRQILDLDGIRNAPMRRAGGHRFYPLDAIMDDRLVQAALDAAEHDFRFFGFGDRPGA
ncbi:MAG: hypothetical protein ACPGID_00490 [Rubricella sp.]